MHCILLYLVCPGSTAVVQWQNLGGNPGRDVISPVPVNPVQVFDIVNLIGVVDSVDSIDSVDLVDLVRLLSTFAMDTECRGIQCNARRKVLYRRDWYIHNLYYNLYLCMMDKYLELWKLGAK